MMNTDNNSNTPRTKFDWTIYADATFAGLAVLIPIPLVDLLIETIFKRRMVHTIAKRNGRKIEPNIVRLMNRSEGCWPGCLVWPITLTFEFLKRLYRTVLYFLTIKAATDQLSLHWHRAFLLDFMMQRGDLDSFEKAQIASLAFEEALKSTTTSPLIQLAQQISRGFNHVFRTFWNFLRRNREDQVILNARDEMEATWSDFSGYLELLAEKYDEILGRYETERVEQEIKLRSEGID